MMRNIKFFYLKDEVIKLKLNNRENEQKGFL